MFKFLLIFLVLSCGQEEKIYYTMQEKDDVVCIYKRKKIKGESAIKNKIIDEDCMSKEEFEKRKREGKIQ